MSELCLLAKSCNFGDYLDTVLRDQFVCGLKDRKIQQELLCTRNLTVGQALDKSRSMEIMLMETQNLHQQEVATRMEEPEGVCGATHKVFKSSRGSCYRCGDVGHSSDSCYHKGKKCNECGKVGHLARACRRKARGSITGKTMHKMDAYEENSDTNSNSNEESDVEVHKVGSKDRYKKLTTQLKINGSLIEFEVDTGAELSTIPQRVH